MSTPFGSWAPVVYGRTREADLWWRALPPSFERRGPLADVVLGAVNGGRDIDDHIRFVLARRADSIVVGGVCEARSISADMNSDSSRPLYCFVGWLSDEDTVAVPRLPDVEEGFLEWAAYEYERWMRPAWLEPTSKLRDPAVTEFGPPPWVTPQPSDVTAAQARTIFVAAPGQIRVHPAESQSLVWDAVVRYGPTDTCLVTGWTSYRQAITSAATDICAADVSAPLVVSAANPRPPVTTRPRTPYAPAARVAPLSPPAPVPAPSPPAPVPWPTPPAAAAAAAGRSPVVVPPPSAADDRSSTRQSPDDGRSASSAIGPQFAFLLAFVLALCRLLRLGRPVSPPPVSPDPPNHAAAGSVADPRRPTKGWDESVDSTTTSPPAEARPQRDQSPGRGTRPSLELPQSSSELTQGFGRAFDEFEDAPLPQTRSSESNDTSNDS